LADLSVDRAVTLRGPQSFLDGLFKYGTLFFSLVVLTILVGIIVSLIAGSWEAFSHFGFGFLYTNAWNPNPDRFQFGALAPIYGTLVTSIIAMLVGVPLSFGVAIFITELCPNWLKRPLSTAIELLAGIPSIVYGMWGVFTLAPFLHDHLGSFLTNYVGHIPVFGALFAAPFIGGVSVLTAGLILAIMVLPFISSIMRDVFETVPPLLKESAYGLGCTTWEVMWNVVLPYTKVGVVGGVMLGLGRAMGETMAVTFVIGNAFQIHTSLLAPGVSISSALASQFNNATESLYNSSLIALGLVLFGLTFIVLAAAKFMLIRLQLRAGT
jgi:phosphate transport system permease protein